MAVVPVNFVAENLNLVGNAVATTSACTNKAEMRKCFAEHGDPSPVSYCVSSIEDCINLNLTFPVIVKPLDRSGSRGITKVASFENLEEAIENAKEQGFEKKAVAETYLEGNEYSVEFISQDGNHHFLALTQKFTTGSPYFIETGHIQPAGVDKETLIRVRQVICHALDSLGVRYGASHSEIKIDDNGNIGIIEIGARMGGDFIGSHLVKLSTGFDFVKGVIDVALGNKIVVEQTKEMCAAVRYIFSKEDLEVFKRLEAEHPEYIFDKDINSPTEEKVTDSSSRFGYYLMTANNRVDILQYFDF